MNFDKYVLHPGRSCGSCDACCRTMPVREKAKGPGVRCPALTRTGKCSEYDSRPNGCAEFFCLWRYGLGDVSMRPDRAGVMLSTSDGGKLPVFWLLDGRRPDMLGRSVTREMLNFVRRGVSVVIVFGPECGRMLVVGPGSTPGSTVVKYDGKSVWTGADGAWWDEEVAGDPQGA